MHESPTFMSSPQQLLYANECHYQQPHQYQTLGDYEVYSQNRNDKDMTLFDSNQDGQDNSTISYVNENLAFGNVAQTQSVTMTGGSQEINSFIATPELPQEESKSKITITSAKRIRRTKQQLADAAKSGAKKKSGQANKHKNATKDRNPGFVRSDYENICSYLEDQDHYNDLFGDSKQTTWGKKTYQSTGVQTDNSNSNSRNCDFFSDSGNSSCEEGRSIDSSITINPGENELHLGISDSNRFTSASGGTNNPSSPRFKEIHTSGSRITSTPIERVKTKGKNH
ncbi:hypothetical protein O181_002348 [Austropuccinia psidii MF-1]|uniref:Uncharacterized protein n=1 Tax=Austropuccinia psidii MF-1 TaxID=1389203 RepID=A0A9Q3BCB5_9BASI|nr:hypothetical protein [Austropuccinia psidii MF-1]